MWDLAFYGFHHGQEDDTNCEQWIKFLWRKHTFFLLVEGPIPFLSSILRSVHDPPGSNARQSSLCNAFDLDDRAVSWRKRLEARARWHGLGEEVNVDLVHGCEILHVCKVDIVLDHLLKRRPRELQDLLEILQDGPLRKETQINQLALIKLTID